MLQFRGILCLEKNFSCMFTKSNFSLKSNIIHSVSISYLFEIYVLCVPTLLYKKQNHPTLNSYLPLRSKLFLLLQFFLFAIALPLDIA